MPKASRPADSLTVAASDLDPDLVLSGDDEKEKERQIQNFVETSRALFSLDGINTFTDTEIAKWLYGQGGHRGKAMAALSETLTWRRAFRTDTLLTEQFEDLESTGKLQFWGRALDKSSLLVWTGSRHVPPKTDQEIERTIRFVIYKLEQARKNGDLSDKLTVIYDRMGMPMDKSDLKIASALVPILQNHYPERLNRMYIFPTSALFWTVIRFAKMYLDPVTVPKILVKDSPVALAEWISRENLFVRYGGLVKDPYDVDESSTAVGNVGVTGGDGGSSDTRDVQAALPTNAMEPSPPLDAGPVTSTLAAASSPGGVLTSGTAGSSSYATVSRSGAAASPKLPRTNGTVKRGVTGRPPEKPMVTIEQVWEAPVEFQDV